MDFGLRAGMPSVELVVEASTSAVWEVLTDLEKWPRWGPTVTGARPATPGPLVLGSRGSVRTPVGLWVPFEITEFVDGRLWAWRVAHVPATRHEVIPASSGCTVRFGVPLWAPAYLAVMAVALPRVARLAAERDA